VKTLAIDCATEACSVALFEDADCIAHVHEILGRGHAERLVPLICGLPDKGCAERILVSLGPGSFTGVRIGLATARALGLAWRAKVFGYPTLALVAAMAHEDHPGEPVTVCMVGGHGEYFVQNFDECGLPEDTAASRTPQEAVRLTGDRLLAGNRAAELGGLAVGSHEIVDILPDARKVPLMPPLLLTSDPAPIYGRAPDAKLPAGGR
jgi:tRNA threonylcarbamoyladenosine biosynthesis protein TsaB